MEINPETKMLWRVQEHLFSAVYPPTAYVCVKSDVQCSMFVFNPVTEGMLQSLHLHSGSVFLQHKQSLQALDELDHHRNWQLQPKSIISQNIVGKYVDKELSSPEVITACVKKWPSTPGGQHCIPKYDPFLCFPVIVTSPYWRDTFERKHWLILCRLREWIPQWENVLCTNMDGSDGFRTLSKIKRYFLGKVVKIIVD